jgi:hypothetical protein
VRETLHVQSRGRAGFERHAWVLDGFAPWWMQRGKAQEPEDLAAAAKALPPDFSARTLDRWFTLRKDTGEDAVRALAASGLHFLAAEYGDAACRDFLSDMLRHATPHDARPFVRDALWPPARRFRAASGATLDSFAARWAASLRAAAQKKP